MSACRDWLSTLWPASFRGVPFYFLNDDEEGGRDVVVHVFPNRDDPFNEDLGEAPRYYGGAAYIHGDAADAQSKALIAAMTTRGAALLTVPMVGPVLVRAMTFKRATQRDQLGYAAFDVKFVREGALTALISVPQFLRLAFLAADALVSTLVGGFPAAVATVGQPGFVAADAAGQVQAAAATLDAIRTSVPADPETSATVRDTVAAIVDAAPVLFARQAPAPSDFTAFAAALPPAAAEAASAAAAGPGQVAGALVYAIRGLASGVAPDVAQHAMIDLAAAFATVAAPPYLTPAAIVTTANAAAIARLARLAALTAWAEALLGRTFVSRADGVTARAEAAERFDIELEGASYSGDDGPLFVAIESLRGAVVDYLSALIADLKPVITVEARRPLPSLWWANRLYADPARAPELVARNGVRHPSFMPPTFQALAP